MRKSMWTSMLLSVLGRMMMLLTLLLSDIEGQGLPGTGSMDLLERTETDTEETSS